MKIINFLVAIYWFHQLGSLIAGNQPDRFGQGIAFFTAGVFMLSTALQ